MTKSAPTPPVLPKSGGSYVRQSDGSVRPADQARKEPATKKGDS